MELHGKGLMISAPKKSSGKTTVALGLTSALTREGYKVRVFKKGPDYIDPMWHKAASGRVCHNIDPYWMSDSQCRTAFFGRSQGIDLSLVEGNHGLHDGLDLKGGNSSAYLAKLLGIPVLLVIDSSGMNHGVAAIVLGQQMLDKDLRIGGVVLNNVANARQSEKQRTAVEYYCGIPVIGSIPRSVKAGIKERHLGLVTVHENATVEKVIANLGAIVQENCDLSKVLAIADNLSFTDDTSHTLSQTHKPTPWVTIGVARDSSFCFYYPENIESLKAAGAELVFFDTLQDSRFPDVDALYIGGGFPESFLTELEDNRAMRTGIKERIEEGMPVYAECGGLMYLARSIERDGIKKEMVGAIPGDVLFQKSPVGKGYSELKINPGKVWYNRDAIIKGHEFHYSRLVNLEQGLDFAYTVQRGIGVDGAHDGILYKNVLAAYTHIHAAVVPDWAEAFVSLAKKVKKNNTHT